MRRALCRAACVVAVITMTLDARADGGIAVVAHPASTLQHLSRDDVAALFLGEKAVITGDSPVVPLDVDDEDTRQAFYQSAANRSLMQIRAYWARMVFTGNGRPPKSLPMDALLERLSTDPSVVSYVPADRVTGLKVLLMLPAP